MCVYDREGEEREGRAIVVGIQLQPPQTDNGGITAIQKHRACFWRPCMCLDGQLACLGAGRDLQHARQKRTTFQKHSPCLSGRGETDPVTWSFFIRPG